ncbi:MAG: hypothetical protein OXG05_16050 [Gammaproteobacteria bacterium]|nr:hypothetical protein [Gammaproteobacteria bacterium]
MTETEFIRMLKEKTRLEVAQEFASPILFSVDSVVLQFTPVENDIARCDTEPDEPDLLTIHCVSWQRLFDVLVGEYDLMTAFLDRDIWTNGYLPLVFRLFALFQPALTTRIPE